MNELLVNLLSLAASLLMLAAGAALSVMLIGKTGNNRWLGLLCLVPIANVVLLFYLVLSTWPVTRELALRRLEAGEGSKDDGRIAYFGGVRAEKAGRLADAFRFFSAVSKRFPGGDFGRDARISIDELHKRLPAKS
jgi:hypothetical protein